MGQSAMQELVCYELENIKVTCQKEVQASQACHTREYESGKKSQAVDEQQVLGYSRHILHIS